MYAEEERQDNNSNSKMKYPRTVKDCTTTDQLRNVDIRKEMDIFPYSNKLQNKEISVKYVCKIWNRLAFHCRPITISLVDEI